MTDDNEKETEEKKEEEGEKSSPLTEFFKAVGVGLARSTLLCAVIAVLIVAGYFLANSKMAGEQLAAFIIIVLIVLAALLVFLFKRGTGEQEQEMRQTLEIPVKVSSNTLDLAKQIPEEIKQEIRKILRAAAFDLARKLSLPEELVRANIFGVDEHHMMRMIKEFTHNMNRPQELSVAIPVGYGSTGIAFKSEKPNIAVFKKDWGASVIEDDELKKVHPDLRWIISVPVLLATEEDETKPVWTLNVDGLYEKKTKEELDSLWPDLLHYGSLISLIISDTLRTKVQ
jgi:hypothetical protein